MKPREIAQEGRLVAIVFVTLALGIGSTLILNEQPVGVAAPHRALIVVNDTDADAVAFVAFGSDSVVRAGTWAICAGSGLTCSFPIAKRTSQTLPFSAYLNATISFDKAVTCGTTKAELNLNNPRWYDVADVSLVDGYSNEVLVELDQKLLGPPHGQSNNERVYGLFPTGCDVCVARKNPPCGMSPGTSGCKAGTQYKPDVPCQHQGQTMGGGSGLVKVVLTKLVPAAVAP